MEEKVLLDAISQMMDEKLSAFKEETNVRFDALQAEIRRVSQSVAVIEVEHGDKLKIINEGVQTIMIDNERLEVHEDKLDDHDNRIWALEQNAKAKNQS